MPPRLPAALLRLPSPAVAPSYPLLLRHRPFSTHPRLHLTSTPPQPPSNSIIITPRAVSRLKTLQEQDANPKLALRVTVESGGCHGFQYNMSLSEKVDPEEDIVFDEEGALVVMDGPSLELLKGSKIDYTMELIGSMFKIVDNPEATSSCGCGTSFDIKGL
ncbi:hypothetical protein EX30DRAFT_5660 [Ascodesmis nigricans]|uniref:Core domain-containing protein n=1 Tax=Ascodesmis nigricans TaxID=341454 RepID=A0A4S2N5V2_9PEZI|nr:hypothetical protein EX30DRAFT_5660 [Ascodesmis nigricans]